MIDFVLDKSLLSLSKEFGFSKLVLVNVIKTEDFEEFKRKSFKEKIVVVEANKKLVRKMFENERVNIIIGLEDVEKKDSLHHRNSGLNQVLCKLAKKNKISVGFSFNGVLNSLEKGKLLGRMMQNVRLCKKYKVNMVLGSFAKSRYDLRLRKDLEAFGRLIGIDKLGNTKVCEPPKMDIRVLG